jgi:hypothetical protein
LRRKTIRGNHGDLSANEISRQCGQPIVVILREAVFDHEILALDIASFFQALAERGQKVWVVAGRPAVKETDCRPCRLLLGARKERGGEETNRRPDERTPSCH